MYWDFNYLQRWQSTYDGGYQGRVIDYRNYEYVVSAKNYEERRDITIMEQQSTKVVISDGGFQRNRGWRTTVGSF
jgi:hypothetical protein